ncbi:MAG: toll/interleukin-1 receptor domain-containing protein [Candidatus Cryptobacteroides sp.]
MAYLPGGNRTISVDRAQDVSFDLRDFVEQVFNDEYALVIGSEVMLNPETVPIGNGDMNSYILGAVNESQHTTCRSFNELIDSAGRGIDPIRNFLSDQGFIQEMSIDDISPELVSLLRLKLFRIVITTTPDPYLEMLLRDIWGDELNVVNIVDDRSLNDFRSRYKEYRGQSSFNEPTLVYAFGKAVKNESLQFARTDSDYICFVERWMKFDSRSDALMTVLQSRRLLSLGCKFEDWYFRFFWYVLRREVCNMGQGQVAITLDTADRSDANLDDFFRRHRVYNHSSERNPLKMNSREFIKYLVRTLTDASGQSSFRKLILEKRRRKGIFISYYHTDEIVAGKLFFKLSRKYPNVWFDTQRLKVGDYNEEIASAISEANIFIPVLSPAVAAHLESGDDAHYYRTEWSLAKQCSSIGTGSRKLDILPVAINGYDMYKPYHTECFERLMNCSNHGIDLMSSDGFAKLTEAIDILLEN